MAEPSYADLLGLANQLARVAGNLKGPIQLTGSEEPDNTLGAPGASAYNLDTRMWYGPKDPVTGWPEGIPLTQGPQGPAGTITDVTVAAGAPGSNASIVLGGTPEARTIAFTLPRGDKGDAGDDAAITDVTVSTGAPGTEASVTAGGTPQARTFAFTLPRGDAGADAVITDVTVESGEAGSEASVVVGGTPGARTLAFTIPRGDTPNVSVEIVMVPHGEPATVTRSGPDGTPLLTFSLPSPLDGEDGREVEFQVSATHIQTRYVGDTAWTDLIALAALKGAKGDKGDAFTVNATGAGLAARNAYDGEPEGFSFVDTVTGLIYFRQGSTGWSDGIPFGQAQSDILDALAALDAAPGVLIQTGAATFAKRPIGASSDTDILDRQAADGRYRRSSVAVPLADVTGLQDALDAKADAAAVLAALGGKQAASDTLNALAALTTTAFGRALLEKTDAAALKSALAIAIADVSGLASALAARVQTVNGVAPDGAGNVNVAAGVSSVAGLTGSVSAGALNAALGLPSEFAQIALTLADLRGDQQHMTAGIADAFDDEDGVASKTGWSYDATNDWYRSTQSATITETTQTLPAMTSDTAPSPWVAEGVNIAASRSPFRAFSQGREDGTTNIYNTFTPWSLTRRASNGQQYRVWRYRIFGPPNSSEGPAAWTLEARNNNTGSWVTLDTQSGQTWSSAGQSRDYVIASGSRGLYSDYRLTVTNGVSIDEIELHQEVASSEPSALTSASFAAGSAPTTAMLTVLLRASAGAYVLNTDVKAFVSRDGGTTWTQVTLVAGATNSGFTTCEGSASLTGQPSGTALRYRIDVVRDGTRQIDVTGVALQWRS